MLTLHNAHQDNIKRVKYLSDHLIMSASADKTLKLWDLRNHSEALTTLKLEWGAEDFCQIDNSNQQLVIANGSVLSVVGINEETKFKRLAEY